MTITLTPQQQAAVAMVQRCPVSILTGGPGTGKTTATLEIFNWARAENLTVAQAAPTGKAAKRMMQATGEYASTIHSLLGCEFEDGHFIFVHGKDNPLDVDLIILDEISMITSSLMAEVLNAVSIRRGTRLLLVGDQDQLPSVGAGAVLRDLLSSKIIPHVELDIIHRNAGSIVTACHNIKQGLGYIPDRRLDLAAEEPVNLIHIESFTPEKTLEGIERLVCKVLPDKYGFDPIDDIQVISPVNIKGNLSCASVNQVLQNALNPQATTGENLQFFPGDKVINTKNMKAETVDRQSTAIVNGDIGILQAVEQKCFVVLFEAPERKVKIPKRDHNLLHAYCITCHRFQGSEAPVIIIPLSQQFNYFLSNAWIYTAISRAKTACITIGTFSTVEMAIRNRIPNNRVTLLADRLNTAHHDLIAKEFAEMEI